MASKNDGERELAEDETEFGRFRDLARKLAQVPKREIDAERDREEAERGD